jgi:phosphoserine phosphatase RsbU/P
MRSSRGWLTLALVLEAAVAAGDAALPDCSLATLLILGPLLAAVLLDTRRTAVVAVLAVALAPGAGLADGTLGTVDHVLRTTLVLIGGVIAVLIARARTVDGHALARMTQVAEVAHRAILHPIPSAIGGMAFAAHYQSASDGAPIGGDFYATVPAPSGLRLIVGDVKGKGLEGVRLAADTLSSFRELATTDMDLVRLAGELDRRISCGLGPEDFVTLILAEFAPGEVRLVNCGHHPPLRVGRRLDLLNPPASTPPLGLDERLLFYTDGLLEARNQAGEMFTFDDRVRTALSELLLSEALAKLLGLVFEHTTGALSDDLVLVLGEPVADQAPRNAPDGRDGGGHGAAHGGGPGGPPGGGPHGGPPGGGPHGGTRGTRNSGNGGTGGNGGRLRGGAGSAAELLPSCWWRQLSLRHWWPW